ARHLDWSRDGKRLAVADWEHDILLLDPADGHELARIAQTKPIEVHFDPGGTRLAATSQDAVLRVWDVAAPVPSLACEAPLPPDTKGWPGELFGASWSPDGKEVVACNYDGRIQVRSAQGGALLRETVRPGMLFVQYSRDGGRDGTRILLSAYAPAYAGNQG